MIRKHVFHWGAFLSSLLSDRSDFEIRVLFITEMGGGNRVLDLQVVIYFHRVQHTDLSFLVKLKK